MTASDCKSLRFPTQHPPAGAGNIGEGNKKFLQSWMDQYVAWM